jgi:type I restriction enzyme M protein
VATRTARRRGPAEGTRQAASRSWIRVVPDGAGGAGPGSVDMSESVVGAKPEPKSVARRPQAWLNGARRMPKRHAVHRSQRSVVARIEEIVLASSGADAFELVFSLVCARLGARATPTSTKKTDRGRANGAGRRDAIAKGLASAAKRWPGLGASTSLDVSDEVLATVSALLDRMALEGDAEALDAVFEQLVTRVGKGDKGQFFTPRHVVDWIARSLLLARGEKVVDPACGSGAFLVHARAQAEVETWGFDVDARAVRVARLIAAASGEDPRRVVRADSLARGPSEGAVGEADVIMTNPPFAGDVAYEGYELARRGRRTERDALFLERCVEMLRPGGRLAIVLPHNKVAAEAWAGLRRWLLERMRVYAVVSLPRETFLPHTAQKAVVLFAQRRTAVLPLARSNGQERVLFAVSERAGKDAGGESLFRRGAKGTSWRDVDHDLDAIEGPLRAFLRSEGNGASRGASSPAVVIRPLAELGENVTLAPERHRATRLNGEEGVLLSSLALERADRVVGTALKDAVVFDTTHAKDGLLDVRAALRAPGPPSSAKKLVLPGDLLVSRLRPYLRQVAFVHPALALECGGQPMACSTEFYVFSPLASGESLAFLLPWLMGDAAQAILGAAQEGGHHPRVPRETVLALRVPSVRVRDRKRISREVEGGIEALLEARRGLARLMQE